MKYKTVLMLFNSFLLVVLVITLLVISSPNNNSESGGTFLPFCIGCQSNQQYDLIILYNGGVNMPGVAFESANVCIRSDIAFKILVIDWSLLGF